MLNSLSFCLSVKLLNSPSYLNEILAGYSNLGCRLFSFITLIMSCHSLLAWRVSIDISAVILMGIPLCVICCFSLVAFNRSSLCLIFVNLINMCLGVFRLGFILFGTLWVWEYVYMSLCFMLIYIWLLRGDYDVVFFFFSLTTDAWVRWHELCFQPDVAPTSLKHKNQTGSGVRLLELLTFISNVILSNSSKALILICEWQ